MEISKDALLRVVKATRSSMKQAEIMQQLIPEKNVWTWSDHIAGFLQDALFDMSGEKLSTGQDFENSNTMRLLTGDMSDEAVADWLIMMDKIRRNHLPHEEVQQPKPQIMDPKLVKDMYDKNGGYTSPEGEWK